MSSLKVNQVLTGIKNLTLAERKELAISLAEIQPVNGRNIALGHFNESFAKVNNVYTAPIGQGGCACCGK